MILQGNNTFFGYKNHVHGASLRIGFMAFRAGDLSKNKIDGLISWSFDFLRRRRKDLGS